MVGIGDVSMSVAYAQMLRPGKVQCQKCLWTRDAQDMGAAIAMFEQHTKDRHADNPYQVAGSFRAVPSDGIAVSGVIVP